MKVLKPLELDQYEDEHIISVLKPIESVEELEEAAEENPPIDNLNYVNDYAVGMGDTPDDIVDAESAKDARDFYMLFGYQDSKDDNGYYSVAYTKVGVLYWNLMALASLDVFLCRSLAKGLKDDLKINVQIPRRASNYEVVKRAVNFNSSSLDKALADSLGVGSSGSKSNLYIPIASDLVNQYFGTLSSRWGVANPDGDANDFVPMGVDIFPLYTRMLTDIAKQFNGNARKKTEKNLKLFYSDRHIERFTSAGRDIKDINISHADLFMFTLLHALGGPGILKKVISIDLPNSSYLKIIKDSVIDYFSGDLPKELSPSGEEDEDELSEFDSLHDNFVYALSDKAFNDMYSKFLDGCEFRLNVKLPKVLPAEGLSEDDLGFSEYFGRMEPDLRSRVMAGVTGGSTVASKIDVPKFVAGWLSQSDKPDPLAMQRWFSYMLKRQSTFVLGNNLTGDATVVESITQDNAFDAPMQAEIPIDQLDERVEELMVEKKFTNDKGLTTSRNGEILYVPDAKASKSSETLQEQFGFSMEDGEQRQDRALINFMNERNFTSRPLADDELEVAKSWNAKVQEASVQGTLPKDLISNATGRNRYVHTDYKTGLVIRLNATGNYTTVFMGDFKPTTDFHIGNYLAYRSVVDLLKGFNPFVGEFFSGKRISDFIKVEDLHPLFTDSERNREDFSKSNDPATFIKEIMQSSSMFRSKRFIAVLSGPINEMGLVLPVISAGTEYLKSVFNNIGVGTQSLLEGLFNDGSYMEYVSATNDPPADILVRFKPFRFYSRMADHVLKELGGDFRKLEGKNWVADAISNLAVASHILGATDDSPAETRGMAYINALEGDMEENLGPTDENLEPIHNLDHESFDLIRHQGFSLRKTQKRPRKTAIFVQAGGGKTIIAVLSAMQELPNNKRAMVICPLKNMVDYLKEVQMLSNGKINVIPVTTETFKESTAQGINDDIEYAPPNTMVIVSTEMLQSTQTRYVEISQSRRSAEQESKGRSRKKGSGFEYRLPVEVLNRFDWGLIVLDESHQAKDSTSNRTRSLRRIISNAERVMIMTGTPVPNQIKDAYVQAQLLDYGMFGTEDHFIEDFQDKAFDVGRRDSPEIKFKNKFKEKVQLVDVKRDEWAVFLPNKVDTIYKAELTPKQSAVYETIAEIEAGKMSDRDISDDEEDVVLTDVAEYGLNRIQQYLTSPAEDDLGRGVLKGRDRISGRAQVVDQLCKNHFRNPESKDYKILIFCQYLKSVDTIYNSLRPENKEVALRYDRTFGDEHKNRMKNDDNVKIVVAVEQNINQSLNLQMFSRIIRAETPYTPGELEQGESRINRPSKQNLISNVRHKVFVDWVIYDRTVDVSKTAKMVSKLVSSAKFDNADDPWYGDDNLKPKGLVKLRLSEIQARPTFDEEIAGEYSLMDYIEDLKRIQEYWNKKVDARREVERDISLVPVKGAGTMEGSKLLLGTSYIPGMKIPFQEDLGLISIMDYAHQRATSVRELNYELLGKDHIRRVLEGLESREDDEYEDEDLTQEEKERQAQETAEEIARLKELLEDDTIGDEVWVHTKFGDGRVVSVYQDTLSIQLENTERVMTKIRKKSAYIIPTSFPADTSVFEEMQKLSGLEAEWAPSVYDRVIEEDEEEPQDEVQNQDGIEEGGRRNTSDSDEDWEADEDDLFEGENDFVGDQDDDYEDEDIEDDIQVYANLNPIILNGSFGISIGEEDLIDQYDDIVDLPDNVDVEMEEIESYYEIRFSNFNQFDKAMERLAKLIDDEDISVTSQNWKKLTDVQNAWDSNREGSRLLIAQPMTERALIRFWKKSRVKESGGVANRIYFFPMVVGNDELRLITWNESIYPVARKLRSIRSAAGAKWRKQGRMLVKLFQDKNSVKNFIKSKLMGELGWEILNINDVADQMKTYRKKGRSNTT